MVTSVKISRYCPRCSREVKGIVIVEDDCYFVSCLSCGFILLDRGRRPSPFGNLFMQFAKMTPEPKKETKPVIINPVTTEPISDRTIYFNAAAPLL